jgi:hypothetical protein
MLKIYISFIKQKKNIEKIAADIGVIPKANFEVINPEVERYLFENKIDIERGEAYNHDVGTPLWLSV